jgi:hypothetical protein
MLSHEQCEVRLAVRQAVEEGVARDHVGSTAGFRASPWTSAAGYAAVACHGAVQYRRTGEGGEGGWLAGSLGLNPDGSAQRGQVGAVDRRGAH